MSNGVGPVGAVGSTWKWTFSDKHRRDRYDTHIIRFVTLPGQAVAVLKSATFPSQFGQTQNQKMLQLSIPKGTQTNSIQ